MKGAACTYVHTQASSLLDFIRSLGAVIGTADREREPHSEEIATETNETEDIAAGVAGSAYDDGK